MRFMAYTVGSALGILSSRSFSLWFDFNVISDPVYTPLIASALAFPIFAIATWFLLKLSGVTV